MAKKMLIDATHAEETRVVVVDGNKVDEFDFESVNKRQLAGNIYLAKVTRVEPSLQAAFVDYGGNRHGFLAFSEIHPDYYQIPVADREALLAEERAYAAEIDEDDPAEKEKPKRRSRGRRRGRSSDAQPDASPAPSDESVATEGAEQDTQDAVAVATDAALEQTVEPTGDDVAAPDVAEADMASADTPDVAEVTEAADPVPAVQEPPEVVGEPVADVPAQDEESAPEGEAVVTDPEAPDTVSDAAEAPAEVEEAPAEENTAAEPASEEAAGSGEDDDTPPRTMAAAARSDDPVTSREPGLDIPGMDVVDLDEEDDQVTALVSPDEASETGATASKPRRSRRPSRSARVSEDEDDVIAEDAADDIGADDDHEDDTAGDDDDHALRDNQIESVAEEDVAEEIRPRKPRPRRYKIQEVIKVRQIMLVQVVKEERGNKGAALTTYLSLAGRYCVLMPNTARGGGISRKITSATDRKKLKQIASEMDVPEGAGLIIRTAGAQRTKSEIKRDYEYLQRLWEQIRELTLKSIAPAPIYEEGDLIKRSIRDLYSREIDEVLVEGERGYRVAKDFMKMIMPSHAKNVRHYQDPLPLLARYQVESYLSSMFNPTVQLKSGGYIVIGVTEALVAIDVNSGRATKEGSIEETALKTNLEAADEVARQLRLRDLAGLIVIDFIDMEERKNNAAVEKRLKDKLKNDRARIQVGRISGFGLLEMSRQRLRPGMIEATTQPCPHCHGTGLIRSDDNLALVILRQIEEEAVRGRSREVLVKAPIGIVNYLMNQKREHVAQIEARYGLSVRVEADPFLISPDFSIERFKTALRSVPEVSAPVISVDTSDMIETVEEEEVEPETEETEAPVQDNGEKPKKRRRRRRKKKSSQTSDGDSFDESAEDGTDDSGDEDGGDDAAESSDGEADAKPKRSRSRRSRNRKPRRGQDTAEDAGSDAAAEDAEQGEPAVVEAVAEPDAAVVEEAAVETPGPVLEIVTSEEVSVSVPDEPTVADDTPTPAVAEEEPEIQPEPQDTPVPEAVADPVPLAASAPEPAVEETAESDDDDKPKRRGWWSLGR
ncbi:Ribonuclease E [Rhodovulum sp. P5]|uniref:Rne/Rng family ribonuclease n=1 Tax=Rhodovulum sp. P5 TaxID=1564506 RepID=UPI0009C39296|nr:ribonuclease E/G [Rhodovulum sp. P5]ARE39189.1 Ribonuclease E [Rhodovulum sp. P5]